MKTPLQAFLPLLLLSLLPFLPTSISAQNALDFDGVNDQVMVANASSLIANGNMSLAFWVLPTNPNPGWPNFDGMAGFRNDVNADFYLLQLSTTNLEARFRNSSGTVYDLVYNGLVPNAWNHLALTYNGTTMVLYHNGSSVATRTATGAITSTNSSLNIGFLPFNNNPFHLDGRMDDVCLYNKALSANEVTALYSDCSVDLSDPNLQLCYEFNQGTPGGVNTSITTLTDSKGNINGLMSGFTMTGQASNFIAYGKNTAAILNPVASCSYTSPSGNYTWSTSGTYYDTIPNAANCDSFITINLSLTTSVLDTLDPDVCYTYTSPSGMNVWDSTGTYQDTIFGGANGCDTIYTIHLSVLSSSASVVDSSCGPYTSPSGNIWTTSGTYADTIPNAANCDSAITIVLTVTNLDPTVTQVGNTLTSNATGVSYQWVNCDSGFAAITGATTASYSASADGSYAVIVSQNGCSDTSACVLLTPSAIGASQFSAGIRAVPNPHGEEFKLLLPQEFGQVKLSVFDLAGKVIFEGSYSNSMTIPVKIEAAPGIYFVQVQADGKLGVLKVQKE